MNKNVKGKVGVVAKTKGMKLVGSDSWYNPTVGCKKKVDSGLLGRMVEFVIDDKGFVSDVVILLDDYPATVDVKVDKIVVKDDDFLFGMAFNGAVLLESSRVQCVKGYVFDVNVWSDNLRFLFFEGKKLRRELLNK